MTSGGSGREQKLVEQDFIVGQALDGKYRIERLLGRGGMGAVYRATHLGTKRVVAIKVIHPQFSNNAEFVERFRREAEAAGRLRHPNVVDVTDFGFAPTRAGRVAYLVMEYLDGCALAEMLDEEGRLPVASAVEILEQVCSADEEAHGLGIIHRDLKPDNIWLEPNRRGGYTVKVLDFGLAKLGQLSSAKSGEPSATAAETAKANEAAGRRSGSEHSTLIKPRAGEEAATLIKHPASDPPPATPTGGEPSDVPAGSASVDAPMRMLSVQPTNANAAAGVGTEAAAALTRVGSVMGTPQYMSPEQCRGERSDARSDIYSLGVIAYRMLAGETPFVGTPIELTRLHAAEKPPPLSEKNRKVPKRIARVVMSALSKDPAERPASAAGFASSLRAGAEGGGALLRQAVSLYSEHFPFFLKISLLAYVPLLLVILLLNFSDRLAPEQFIVSYGVVVGPLMFLCMIAANLIAYFTVSAANVPAVIQLMVAPLRPLSLRTTLLALRRRWPVFLLSSVVVTAMILFGTLLFVIPGAVAAVCYALYAPVVVMEGTGVRSTLKRARRLMKRSWATVLLITALQFALPIVVWSFSVHSTFTLRLAEDYSPKEVGYSFDISGTSSLYQLLNIFVTPLLAIMTALLYLKTRRAGGESLKDAAEQFDALEIPRSRWQAKMRSRSASSVQPGTSARG